MSESRNTIATPPTALGEPAWQVALLFPNQGQWTEEEYLALETNRMVELSDGCLEVLPMPTLFHQAIVRLLFQRLDGFVRANAEGEVFFAPLPVRLWASKFREPDLVYLRPDRIRNRRGQPDGADLVMEVVSPGDESRERDLVTKREEYAKACIAEYWIVDPQERRISVLALAAGTYEEHGVFMEPDVATSRLLPGFHLTIREVLAAGEGSHADAAE